MNETSNDQLLIEQEHSKFINLIESDPNPVIIIDSNCIIKEVNQQVFQKFGFNPDETLGMNINFLIESADIQVFESAIATFFKGDGSKSNKLTFNSTVLNKLKDNVPINVKLNVLESKADQPTSAIIRLIVDKNNSDELLEKYTQMLQAKNKELEQFAYVASHDLKEPVRTIMSFTELLGLNYGENLDDRGKQCMKFITEASDRMNMLISDLLDYSRIGRNSERASIDLNKVVDSVIADLNTTIEESEAQINYSELPECKVYPTEMRLLFQNLIENAVKFRRERIAPIINIQSKKSPKEVEISISDNGIGVEEKFQERIFMVFQRLHTRDTYEGSGIGLAHCKKIIEFHGGKIWIESKVDEGSTFIFTIPT